MLTPAHAAALWCAARQDGRLDALDRLCISTPRATCIVWASPRQKDSREGGAEYASGATGMPKAGCLSECLNCLRGHWRTASV
jgi:hypothetical protein